MRLLHEEHGFTAMELLVAGTLFIIVLGAALTPMNTFWRTNKTNEQQNVSQQGARQTVDRMATELRSIGGQSQLIEKAANTDIVFKSTDALTNPSGSNPDNVKRIRYCLNGSNLVRQEQTWTTATAPAVPSTNTCPDGAWPNIGSTGSNNTNAATDIVNPGSVPIFSYDVASPLANIRTVTADFQVDPNPGVAPNTTELKTAITLRNTDLAPVASFIAVPTGSLQVSLDGTGAYDPEGTSLTYRWCITSLCSAGAAIGTGSTLSYTAGSAGSMTFYLDVTDASGITAEGSQTVTVS